jgi:hypothetical protein
MIGSGVKKSGLSKMTKSILRSRKCEIMERSLRTGFHSDRPCLLTAHLISKYSCLQTSVATHSFVSISSIKAKSSELKQVVRVT